MIPDDLDELADNAMHVSSGLLDWNAFGELRRREGGLNPGVDSLDIVRLEDVVEVGFVEPADFPRRGNPDGMTGLLPFRDGAAQRLIRRAGLRIVIPAGDDEAAFRQCNLAQTAQRNPGFEPGG